MLDIYIYNIDKKYMKKFMKKYWILNVNKIKVKFNGFSIIFTGIWIVLMKFEECNFFYVKGLPCPKKEENLSSTCFFI